MELEENDTPSGRGVPRHFWYHEQEQYRLKVQRFTRMPPEVTVQRISFDRDARAYENAYENGCSRTTPRRGTRTLPAERDAESIERSQRRAKTRVRLAVTELAPTAMVTFTTREVMPLDALLEVWGRFTRLMRVAGFEFEYVAVPEPHQNRDHLHLHVAYRGRTPFNVMRRFWHIALEARHGRAVRCILRGAESPGNVQVERVKARDDLRRIRKIARYVSKYITKDLIAEFNRRRYWPSQGINLAAAEAFWLDSLDASSAIREACMLVGEWDFEGGVPAQRMFRPSDRVCWFAVDPAASPPPF
jgi:hypothetical protein